MIRIWPFPQDAPVSVAQAPDPESDTGMPPHQPARDDVVRIRDGVFPVAPARPKPIRPDCPGCRRRDLTIAHLQTQLATATREMKA